MDDYVKNDKLASFASYAEKHELFDLFKFLTRRLSVTKPEDPIPYLIQEIQSKRVLEIYILGTPACGKTKVCKRLAEVLGVSHVSTSALLARHIAKKSSFGLQAKSSFERGELVPDSLMFQILSEELEESNLRNTGYVVEGFPRTAEQAHAIRRRGLFPTHMFYLEVPAIVAEEHVTNLLTDPLTNIDYNMKIDPPKDSQVLARLVRRQANSSSTVKNQISLFEADMAKVKQSCNSQLKVIHCSLGILGHESEIIEQLVGLVKQRPVSYGDKQFRIIIAGMPGSGKSSVARLLCDKYGLVHVSPKNVMLEAIDAQLPEADLLRGYLTEPEFAPDDLISRLIIEKLKTSNSLENGWVLEGWPLTESQAAQLQGSHIEPTRVILLKTPQLTALDRLRHRRYDKENGRCVYLPNDQQGESNYVARAEDSTAIVEARSQAHAQAFSVLERKYGARSGLSSQYSIDKDLVVYVASEGTGEGDGLGTANYFYRKSTLLEPAGTEGLPRFSTAVLQSKERRLEPSLLTTFEKVENAVLTPIPVINLRSA